VLTAVLGTGNLTRHLKESGMVTTLVLLAIAAGAVARSVVLSRFARPRSHGSWPSTAGITVLVAGSLGGLLVGAIAGAVIAFFGEIYYQVLDS
jgi:fructose-specific phosphotransferase system IIC component